MPKAPAKPADYPPYDPRLKPCPSIELDSRHPIRREVALVLFDAGEVIYVDVIERLQVLNRSVIEGGYGPYYRAQQPRTALHRRRHAVRSGKGTFDAPYQARCSLPAPPTCLPEPVRAQRA